MSHKYKIIPFIPQNLFSTFLKLFLAISNKVIFSLFKLEIMDFIKIDGLIRAAVEKRKKLLYDALDGRTQRWLSEKTGIEETRLSRWVNGGFILEEWETEKIDTVLAAVSG